MSGTRGARFRAIRRGGLRQIITRECELASWLRTRPHGLIALDGYHGVGKTTLARTLAKALNIRVISIDSYVTPRRGAYVAEINFEELEGAVSLRPVLLEGVCVLDILRLLGLSPDVFVYMDSSFLLGHPRNASPLAAEISAYHRRFSPAASADVIFKRSPSKGPCEMDSSRVSVDIAYIKAKATISIVLAVGGMMTLIVGLVLLFYGVSGEDKTIIKLPGVEMSAGGLGGVIMATSIAWAYFSYRSRPSYSHSSQMSEEYSPEVQLLTRTEFVSATEAIVDPDAARALRKPRAK